MVCVDNRKKAVVVKFENVPSCAIFETSEGELFYKLCGECYISAFPEETADGRANAVNLFTGALDAFASHEEVTIPNAKLVIEQ